MTPVRHDDGPYLTVDQIQRQTNLCRATILRLATEAKAMLRIGKAIRINSEKLFKYMEKEYLAQ